ncbi:MAG: HD domain-containing protein [Armatimonadetes bacterium]|nr:HD domain-containing protein [Armatimonadota bacterium]
MPRFGPPIQDFARGSKVEAVPVVVAEASAMLTKDQKPYGKYVLRDQTGTIPGIWWDHQVDAAETGAIALVTGTVDEYRGAPQFRMADLRLLELPGPEVLDRLQCGLDPALQRELLGLLKQARESLPECFWLVFVEALGHDPFDLGAPFWNYAAAQSKHHANRGGLAWHVLTMYAHVEAVAAPYPKLDRALLKLAVLTHDLGKLDCYEMGAVGARQLSLDRTVGHTSYSMSRVCAALGRLRERGVEISREDEENLLHCIAGHHGRKEWGAVCEPATPEAAALHALDYLDSQVRGLTDPRPCLPPERGTAPKAVAVAEEPEADPFLDDTDDPFDEPSDRPSQPSLF